MTDQVGYTSPRPVLPAYINAKRCHDAIRVTVRTDGSEATSFVDMPLTDARAMHDAMGRLLSGGE